MMTRPPTSGILACLLSSSLLLALGLTAQTPGEGKIMQISIAGLQKYSHEQVIELTGLHLGALVTRESLQAAADRLAEWGWFSQVNYEFQSRGEEIHISFHVEEAPTVPVFFDNIPWYTDAELADAVRKSVPLFDGSAPQQGAVLDRVGNALQKLLDARGIKVAVEHDLVASPVGDAMVQRFSVVGAGLKIASLQFSDPLAASSRPLQQRLPDIVGKPFSRFAIEVFLTEQVRPLYLAQGYLHVKLGAPEVRLTGNPNQPLPDSIPVFVPVETGPVYRWKGVEWQGNLVLTASQLQARVTLKSGDPANELKIEGIWQSVQDEYAHRGYLDALLQPIRLLDETEHTVSYRVQVNEGVQYRFGEMMITGLSLAAEKKLWEWWHMSPGEIFDRSRFEDLLLKLQTHSGDVFGELPVHYDQVGHWLQTHPGSRTVDVLLDFK